MPLPYTKEQIAEANNVNLIGYATMHGYQFEKSGGKALHIKESGGLYLFRNSNKFYHHVSNKTGGPIDFVMQFEGRDFLEAVEHLIGISPKIGGYVPPPAHAKKREGVMVLPDKATCHRRAYWYLAGARGIEPEIVAKLMREKKIYQQAGRGNCVFVGYDENNVPKYCAKRGTSPGKPYKGDADHSDKSYPFSMPGTSVRLFVMESPIDAMSHASLFKLRGLDHVKDHRISLGGLSDRALAWYLGQHPEIRQIVFALDNDTDGKASDGSPCNHGQEAAGRLAAKYEDMGYHTAVQTPSAKDFNEDLMNIRREQEAARAAQRDGEQEVAGQEP